MIAKQPKRLCQMLLYDRDIFVSIIINGGVLFLQRATDKDREARGSPDYGRVARQSRGKRWHCGSPGRYHFKEPST